MLIRLMGRGEEAIDSVHAADRWHVGVYGQALPWGQPVNVSNGESVDRGDQVSDPGDQGHDTIDIRMIRFDHPDDRFDVSDEFGDSVDVAYSRQRIRIIALHGFEDRGDLLDRVVVGSVISAMTRPTTERVISGRGVSWFGGS